MLQAVLRSRVTRVVLLALGLGLMAWVVSRYPLVEILEALRSLGPEAALIMLFPVAWTLTNAAATHAIVGGVVPFGALVRNRLVSEGWNSLLPLGVAGEPWKALDLGRWLPQERAVAAVVYGRLIDNMVGLGFSALCLLLGTLVFDIPTSARSWIWIFVAVAVGQTVIYLLLAVSRLPARFGRWMVRVLGRKAAEMPEPVPRGQLARAAAWQLAGRLLGAGEVGVLLIFLDLPADPLHALFLFGGITAAQFLGFFVPAGVGVTEAASVFAFSLLGWPGALAVAHALARRARLLVFGIVGLLLHLVRPGR